MYHSYHQTTIATNNINNTSNTSNLIVKHHQQKYVPSKQVQHQQQVNSQKEFILPKHSHHHHHHHHSTYHQQLLLAHAVENNSSTPNSSSNKSKKSKKKKNKKKEIFLDSLPLHEVSSSTEDSKPQTPANEKEENKNVEKKDMEEQKVVATSSVPKQDEEICVICHGPLPLPHQEEEERTTEIQEEMAQASPCQHKFCYGCIKKWCFEYCSECPMCKTHIDKLIVGHCREEELENLREEFIEKKEYQLKREETVVDAQAEFACLDHRYFLGEIEILLNQVIHIHSGLKMTSVQFNSNYRLQSRAKNNHQRKYTKISELKDTLVGLQLEMRRMSQNIDPVVLMQQLYQIQESISEFSDHQVHDTIVQQQQHDAYMYYQQNPYALQTSSNNDRVLYSAKDFVDEYEDDYDKAYWEEDNFYRQAAREDAYFDTNSSNSSPNSRRNRRK